MTKDPDNIKTINEYLVQNFEPYLIILFGSQAKGTFREDSDIDIAFLSEKECSSYELFMVAQQLASELGREVDLVDLKKASTVFKAQIVGTGTVIYCLDESKRILFQMRTFKDYALLNEERAEILNKIRQRGTVYGG